MRKRVRGELVLRARLADGVDDVGAVPERIARQIGARIGGVPVLAVPGVARPQDLPFSRRHESRSRCPTMANVPGIS
jgi:hypothetical protein